MLEYEREDISIAVYAAASDACAKNSSSGACRFTDAPLIKQREK
jgi:hypothetical protein